jgi:hypothetical protein
MLAHGLLLALCIAAPLPVAAHQQDPNPLAVRMAEVVKHSARTGLRSVATDVAKCGLREEVMTIHAVLLDLGDDEKELAKMLTRWEKSLEKPTDSEKARGRAMKKLQSKLKPFEVLLRGEGPMNSQEKEHLASALLRLDSTNEAAHVVLEHRLVAGDWLTEEEITWRDGAKHIEGIIQQANNLEIHVTHGPSSNIALKNLYEEEPHVVSANGVFIHGGYPVERMERILREVLRAHAISRGLVTGSCAPREPKSPVKQFVFLPGGHTDYLRAIEEAKTANNIDQTNDPSTAAAFRDKRGWETGKWGLEGDHQAWLLYRLISGDPLMDTARPTLVAGHTNWLCQRLYGVSIPGILVRQENTTEEHKTSGLKRLRKELMWLTATCSLHGCKSWMRGELNAGRQHLWANSFLDQIGKIQDAKLLKTTLMVDFLQITEEFQNVLKPIPDRSPTTVEQFEHTLGRSLPELEEEWTRWLMGPGHGSGVLQQLHGSENDEEDTEDRGLIELLQDIKRRASADIFRATVEYTYGYQVELHQDSELSEMAQAHAAYLTINKDQQSKWPDAHEEYSDREGFSPEGAWAGTHAVIAFTPNPKEAVRQWMGTFYHRLPLLEPGLFGVGLGVQENVTVLDTNSLVAPYRLDCWVAWPPADEKDIPRRFVPEMPNPVPGEEQAEWGYPITLQVYSGSNGQHNVQMHLFEGSSAEGKEVLCHYLTPFSSKQDKLRPSNAYCLIPKTTLKPNANYTVTARCSVTKESKTWTFKTGK